VSAIFSNTFADDKFGIGLSATYQERDSGYSQAAVANGWKTMTGDTTDGSRLRGRATPTTPSTRSRIRRRAAMSTAARRTSD
jgi:hypothetical protein